MEQFKEKIKQQNIVLAIGCLILLAFSVLGFVAEMGLITLIPTGGDSHWQSMWRGFMSGASMGVMGLMLFGLIRNFLALKDEKKLKKLYVSSRDERSAMLFHNARSAAMSVFLIFGLIAVIITGFFSPTVSITILMCVASCSVLCVGFKLYYNKKY